MVSYTGGLFRVEDGLVQVFVAQGIPIRFFYPTMISDETMQNL